MIILNLFCENQHEFEGWFKSEYEYNRQLTLDMVCCPFCDSTDITRNPGAELLAKSFSQDLLTLDSHGSTRMTEVEKQAKIQAE